MPDRDDVHESVSRGAGAEAEVVEHRETTCCIVGGGPAGIMLGLLLARADVPVLVLESHNDFDRDFRGDTIQASTLEVLDQIGLADPILKAIPHGKIETMTIVTPEGRTPLADLRRLKTKFPYVATIPQAEFLTYLAEEARKLPSFNLVMGANVQRLVEEEGVVKGVRYRGAENTWHEVRATLTVAADGRFSKIRSLLGLEPIKTSPPMDILWFRLPRRPDDACDLSSIAIHDGHFVVVLERADQWQVGFAILKGSFQQVRKGGLDEVKRLFAEMVPALADRIDVLTDWKQIAVLSVESNLLERWYQPGLLLIGDAAHVISPVGGVGINVAIQDAVEAANLLTAPLKEGRLQESDLAALQTRREGPVRAIQKFQERIQKTIIAQGFQAGKAFRLPWPLRILNHLPILRDYPAKMIAFGSGRGRVENAPQSLR